MRHVYPSSACTALGRGAVELELPLCGMGGAGRGDDGGGDGSAVVAPGDGGRGGWHELRSEKTRAYQGP